MIPGRALPLSGMPGFSTFRAAGGCSAMRRARRLAARVHAGGRIRMLDEASATPGFLPSALPESAGAAPVPVEPTAAADQPSGHARARRSPMRRPLRAGGARKAPKGGSGPGSGRPRQSDAPLIAPVPMLRGRAWRCPSLPSAATAAPFRRTAPLRGPRFAHSNTSAS